MIDRSKYKRIDLHSHTLFSDGDLIPSELLRRAAVKGYQVLAVTDHCDWANVDIFVPQLVAFQKYAKDFDVLFLPGVEITHTPPEQIAPLAKKARELGALIVGVHGETIVEPVAAGTNLAAAQCTDVDYVAHPGLITDEAVREAVKNNVYLEITTRGGHSFGNGHTAKMAKKYGAKLILNSDSHHPRDLTSFEDAFDVGLGCGMEEQDVFDAMITNPVELLKRRGVSI